MRFFDTRVVMQATLLVGVVALAGVGGCTGEKDCLLDTECGAGEVCARSAECLPESRVRKVQVRWTIRGEEAVAANCAQVGPLEIKFLATREDMINYTPLACEGKLFTLDKMPSRMTQVEIDGPVVTGRAGIPADGQVQMDLR